MVIPWEALSTTAAALVPHQCLLRMRLVPETTAVPGVTAALN